MVVSQPIVSLISSATEILFGIGAGPRLVAVSHECDYPAEAKQLPAVTRSRIDSSLPSSVIDQQVASKSTTGMALYELDEQLIRKLRPKLIITQAQCDVCAVRYADVIDVVQSSSELADTQVLALNPSSLDDVIADVLRIGQATGLADSATTYVDTLRARIRAISERTSQLTEVQRPRTACIEWVEPLMFAANWTPQLIRLAGGQPILAKAGSHSTYGSWNDLVRHDPQAIFVSPCGFDLDRSMREARTLLQTSGWSGLTAVKSGRVWVIDGNEYLNRSGPRLVDSLEILAHLLHPAIFARPSWSSAEQLPWAQLLP